MPSGHAISPPSHFPCETSSSKQHPNNARKRVVRTAFHLTQNAKSPLSSVSYLTAFGVQLKGIERQDEVLVKVGPVAGGPISS